MVSLHFLIVHTSNFVICSSAQRGQQGYCRDLGVRRRRPSPHALNDLEH